MSRGAQHAPPHSRGRSTVIHPSKTGVSRGATCSPLQGAINMHHPTQGASDGGLTRLSRVVHERSHHERQVVESRATLVQHSHGRAHGRLVTVGTTQIKEPRRCWRQSRRRRWSERRKERGKTNVNKEKLNSFSRSGWGKTKRMFGVMTDHIYN